MVYLGSYLNQEPRFTCQVDLLSGLNWPLSLVFWVSIPGLGAQINLPSKPGFLADLVSGWFAGWYAGHAWAVSCPGGLTPMPPLGDPPLYWMEEEAFLSFPEFGPLWETGWWARYIPGAPDLRSYFRETFGLRRVAELQMSPSRAGLPQVAHSQYTCPWILANYHCLGDQDLPSTDLAASLYNREKKRPRKDC